MSAAELKARIARIKAAMPCAHWQQQRRCDEVLSALEREKTRAR
jgi:hypothetical protein